MTPVQIRAAMLAGLKAIDPTMPTARENETFTPPPATARYQRTSFMFASPANAEFGASYAERGIFQVDLVHPGGEGSGHADARAQQIRTAFQRGATFTKDGNAVQVHLSPSLLPSYNDADGRFVLSVSIPFTAFVAG